MFSFFFPCAAAQVEVLSAALRASSLDPQEETTASVGKGTDSQAELTISDQQNFKPILGDIVPLIGDTVEVRCLLCAFFPRSDFQGSSNRAVICICAVLAVKSFLLWLAWCLVLLAGIETPATKIK